MKDNRIIKAVVFSSIVFLLVLNILLLRKLVLNKIEKQSTIEAESFISKEFLALDYCLKTSISNNDLIIRNIETKYLKKDLINGQCLVIRFSELNCRDCVNFLLLKTKKLIKNKNIRVILLSNYSSKTQSKIICNQFELNDVPMYNIQRLYLPIEECGYPYCFIIDSTYRVSNVFVPDRNLPTLTSTYFNMIEKRYFKGSGL